jgi:hypothetical protein
MNLISISHPAQNEEDGRRRRKKEEGEERIVGF